MTILTVFRWEKIANKTISKRDYFEGIEIITPVQNSIIKALEILGPSPRRDLVSYLNTPRTTKFDNLKKLQNRKQIEFYNENKGQRGRPLRIWKLIDKEIIFTEKREPRVKKIVKPKEIKTKSNVKKIAKTTIKTKTKNQTKSKPKTKPKIKTKPISKTKTVAKNEDKKETINIPLGNGEFRTYKVLKKLDAIER